MARSIPLENVTVSTLFKRASPPHLTQTTVRRGPRWRTPPQGHEGDAVSVEPIEAIISGELGIEDAMLGQCAVLILPELDEAEDLFCLLAFADIGIGIAEHLRIRILRQKGEDAGLPAASL